MDAGYLRFDAAINPYGCSPKVVEALGEFARSKDYRLYGDETAQALRRQLAEHYDLSPENFAVYNGTGEALVWLFISHLLLRQGRLLVPYPSYERFVTAGKRCASEVVEVPLDEADFSLPVDRFAEEGRRRKVAVGLLSNPNNPSGNLLLHEEGMSRLLEEVPECLWIVDEAYADYAGNSFVAWVRERKNLVVLRTFSKAYGLAGLRVGYAVGHAALIQALAGFRMPWCVNSMSLVAAQAALADQGYLVRIVGQIRADCAQFCSRLQEVPCFQPHPSAANFFLVRLREAQAETLKARLAEQGIRVRSRPDMPRHLRITCLRPEENQRLWSALEAL
jgi:histidinol-phosphate aminotransferase